MFSSAPGTASAPGTPCIIGTPGLIGTPGPPSTQVHQVHKINQLDSMHQVRHPLQGRLMFPPGTGNLLLWSKLVPIFTQPCCQTCSTTRLLHLWNIYFRIKETHVTNTKLSNLRPLTIASSWLIRLLGTTTWTFCIYHFAPICSKYIVCGVSVDCCESLRESVGTWAVYLGIPGSSYQQSMWLLKIGILLFVTQIFCWYFGSAWQWLLREALLKKKRGKKGTLSPLGDPPPLNGSKGDICRLITDKSA